MSNFNQPPGKPYGQGNYTPQNTFNPPQQSSGGGGNVWIVVLAVVGGIFVLMIGACLFMAMMVKNSVEEFAGQFSELAAESVVESIVSEYEDNEIFIERLGAVEDYKLTEEDVGFEIFTKRKLEIQIDGEKSDGVLILYRKGGKPDRVMLLIDGEEILLDDNPSDTLGNSSDVEWEENSEWDEEFVPSETDGPVANRPGFGEEEFADQTTGK